MRLMIMGQQSFGQKCVEAILQKGEDEIVGVYCAPDKEGKPIDPIKEFALASGLRVFQPDKFSSEKVKNQIRELAPDLCVMAYVVIFVPEEVRGIPKYGSICFHPSLLPKHRGPSSINWPIIAGANETGLTIFWPNDGLDEGEILLQKKVNIEPNDTLGDVYFSKIFPLGIEAILESIKLVAEGKAPKVPQNNADATYESWCDKKAAKINWSMPTEQIYNLIRGTNPQPGAWTTYGGKELKIFDCAMIDGTYGNAGEIIQLNSDGFVVGTLDQGILAKRVKFENNKKIVATEFVTQVGLKVGEKFS